MSIRKLRRWCGLHILGPLFGSRCPACGRRTLLRGSGEFPPALAEAWNLSPQWQHWFVQRERYQCQRCGCEQRVRHFAEILVREFNTRLKLSAPSLDALCRTPEMASLRIAEINSLGRMHQFLARLPGLRYSEYGSTNPAIPHQDLMQLSYPDASFDVVLTSETLEHVPDARQALSEIRRILVPGGLHCFTIPVVWDQPKSRRRAHIEDGRIVHLLPPSHHGDPDARAADYLVFTEFGADVEQLVRDAGFALRIERHPRNPALSVFIARSIEAGNP